MLKRRDFLAVLAAASACRAAFGQRTPCIVLDPGHMPSQPGALSASGIYEVEYNDRFVAELAPRLVNSGWRVFVSRLPEENKTLEERTQFAAEVGADVFLSIHHDSVQERFTYQHIDNNGKPQRHTTEPFSGHSFFVSKKNPRYENSYRFAYMLARYVAATGRKPALYHADRIKGESRPLLNKKLGIYRYDDLAVLRTCRMPAVLMEVGVLPDKADEAWLSIAKNRAVMQQCLAWGAEALLQSGII